MQAAAVAALVVEASALTVIVATAATAAPNATAATAAANAAANAAAVVAPFKWMTAKSVHSALFSTTYPCIRRVLLQF